MSEIKRVLAEAVRVTEKCAIEGADLIELVKIRGWQVVVQKGLYEVGDIAVYFSIDALLPEVPEFEFLRDRCFKKETAEGPGFRIKTIKLKGQLSQGMMMPLKEITYANVLKAKEDDDLTDILRIKKYEPPLPANLAGNARGNFPSFIPKTDEHRIQNFIGRFKENYASHLWEVSLKLDGSSMTVYHNKAVEIVYVEPKTIIAKVARWFSETFLGATRPKTRDAFGVCSRNIDLKESDDNTFWQTANKLELRDILTEHYEATGRNLALQGEMMGPGIQGNRENLKETDYFVFNIWDIDQQRYLNSVERSAFLFTYDLNPAHVYETKSFEDFTSDDFLELADKGYGGGKSINHPIREGLVFKSTVDPSISFKAISNRFLLKEKD
jgi:RNA ligase (TIGR02306 family)